jgi:sugar O-acyltransferase (sialic acid O-acetyltransferase NeuD family)
MRKLVFLGAGGIAIVAAEIARSLGFEIVGFLDDKTERHGTVFCDAKVLGSFDMLPELRQGGVGNAAVAFAHCLGRLKVAHQALAEGFTLPNLIHPSAIISPTATIGHGAIMMAGTIVNAASRIGANIIINTAASIDHECMIGDSVHIAPGSRLSGLVRVGSATYIGVGTTIRESINIGSNVMVGAGSLVLKDIPDDVVAYGSPAKVVRANSSSR